MPTVSANALARIATSGIGVLADWSAIPDLSSPNGTTTVWQYPRDGKMAILAAIQQGLTYLAQQTPWLAQIRVFASGSFSFSALRPNLNQPDVTYPVITVSRLADPQERRALGDVIATLGGQSSQLVSSPSVSQTSMVMVKGSWSRERIGVDLYDLNGYRRDQLYHIIKTMLMVSENAFSLAGYIGPTRVDAGDEETMVDGPAPILLFHSHFIYEIMYSDEVASIQQLAALVQQQLTTLTSANNSAQPTTAQETASL